MNPTTCPVCHGETDWDDRIIWCDAEEPCGWSRLVDTGHTERLPQTTPAAASGHAGE